jgi:hypothetical protein
MLDFGRDRMSGSYLPGGRSFGARWLALVILCAASLMVILDGTIVTVALPTIQVGLALLTTLAASRTGSGTSAQDLTSGYRLALVAGRSSAALPSWWPRSRCVRQRRVR